MQAIIKDCNGSSPLETSPGPVLHQSIADILSFGRMTIVYIQICNNDV